MAKTRVRTNWRVKIAIGRMQDVLGLLVGNAEADLKVVCVQEMQRQMFGLP